MVAPAAATRVTPDDLLRMGDAGKGFELVDGELVELPMSRKSSYVAGTFFRHLGNYCDSRGLGWVFPEGTAYQCFDEFPGRVRKADASFVSFSRMPADDDEDVGFIAAVPDLVVEVISPNDNAYDVNKKVAEWLRAGVRVLWEIYPDAREVHVHKPDGSSTTVSDGDTLTCPEVLSEFAVPVADLFKKPS